MTLLSTRPEDTARVPDLLAHARTLCTPVLQALVGRLAPPMDTVAAYHFGWADESGRPVSGDGGKAVRAALALLSATAVDAPGELGVAAGAALELVHNFSLVHDDLMDGDETRRHRTTVWKVFGDANAILAGDALLVLANSVLFESAARPADAARAVERLNTATAALIDGQAKDLAFEERDTVTVEDYLDMAGGKTGALLAASSSLGAVLAGADEATAESLAGYGRHLGLAFQAVDDLLGIWGEPEVTGKPRWGDLRRRKKSLPVAAALAAGGPASDRLAEQLADQSLRGRESEEQLAARARLIVEAGGREWAADEARRHHHAALAALDETLMPDEVRRDFTALADFILVREK